MEEMTTTDATKAPSREAIPLGCKMLFVVYDRVSGTSTAPVMRDNADVARREYATVCQDPDSQYARFPADFSLRLVGRYDIQSCRLTPCDPKDVAFATEFANPNTQEA